MPKLARDQDGLTPQEAKFAVLLSQGATGAEAFRGAFVKRNKIKPESCWQGASQVRARPHVASRVKTLLSHARLQDIDSVGEALQRTKDLIGESRENRNFSAAAKCNGDLLKIHGLLRDSLVVSFEGGLSDEQLVSRLANGDPKLLHAAQQLLRAPSSFPKVADDPTVIDVTPVDEQGSS